MQVCNAAVRDSAPLVTQTPPPPEVLTELRRMGRRARLHGAGDSNPVVSLLATLPEALKRRLVFFQDQTSEMSFDEAWLLNLFDAVRTNDHDRYFFAMLSRMSKAKASELHFFVIQAVQALDKV